MNQQLEFEADPFATSLAGRRLGRYEVLARLASGGMASVYVARALGVAGFERLFAIKVLHPHLAHEQEFITMFLDEARLAARIRHPNVVATIDISDTEDAGYYLVMDYIEGDHLGAILQHAFKKGERLPSAITLRVLVDALEGLSAAHSLKDEHGNPLNLVHRDISPHNIMVSTDGVARLTDFGVAKAESRLSNTSAGQFKGKLAYMAPEHASGGEAEQRSDLFAMAIVLWESLAGRRLFRAENQAATLNKICLEPVPLLSEVDPELKPFDDLLIKALAREPQDRFQTAHEFAEAIEDQADSLGGIASPRNVGKLVREFAADKIEHDHQRIREAIANLSQSPPTEIDEGSGSRPREHSLPSAAAAPQVSVPPVTGGESMPAASMQAQVSAPPRNVPTRSAAPAVAHAPPPPMNLAETLEGVHLEPPAQGNPNRRTFWIAAVLVGLAAGVAAATLLWGGSSNDQPRAPIVATPSEETPGATQPSSDTAAPSQPEAQPSTTAPQAPTQDIEKAQKPAKEAAAASQAQAPAQQESALPSTPKSAAPRATPRRRSPRPSRNPTPKRQSDKSADDLLLNPYR